MIMIFLIAFKISKNFFDCSLQCPNCMELCKMSVNDQVLYVRHHIKLRDSH